MDSVSVALVPVKYSLENETMFDSFEVDGWTEKAKGKFNRTILPQHSLHINILFHVIPFIFIISNSLHVRMHL